LENVKICDSQKANDATDASINGPIFLGLGYVGLVATGFASGGALPAVMFAVSVSVGAAKLA
jgi:hypothetical protein